MSDLVIRVAVRALETVHGSGLAPAEQAAEFDGVEQPYLATRCCYSCVGATCSPGQVQGEGPDGRRAQT